MFDVDISELENLVKKLEPKNIKRLESNYINALLFGLRKYTITNKDGLQKEFTIRNKGLARYSIRISKCNSTTLIGYFGSISSKRFTGWKEQQEGKQPKRKRVAMPYVRGKSGKRKIPTKYRLNQTIRSSKNVDYDSIKSGKQRIAIFLSANRRQGYKGPLIINEDIKGMPPPGVYQMIAKGKIKAIQLFRQMHIKHNPWATDIIKRYMKQEKHGIIVMREIHRLLAKQ
jgi:hypothetical protein